VAPKKIKSPSKSSIFSSKTKFQIVRKAKKKTIGKRSSNKSARSQVIKSSFVEKPAEPILIDGTADNKED